MSSTGSRRPLSLFVALPLLAPALLVGTTNASAAPPAQVAAGGCWTPSQKGETLVGSTDDLEATSVA